MPFILIKNYLKLMLRNKWILMMMTIFPLIIIALLANVFKDMFDTDYKIDTFQVGYRISEDSIYHEILPQLKAICEDNNVILKEYPVEDITGLLKDRTVTAFVDITEDAYTIYKSDDKMTEAAITESIFSSFFYQVNENMTMMSYGIEPGNPAVNNFNVQVISEKLDTEPVPSSIDYYGIIYIIYGTWCGMVTLVSVVSSERKGSVLKRMRVSHISRLSYYIGKLVPGALALFIEVCVAWILSVLFFNIHWGNIGTSIFIVFLTSIATIAFGILLFQLFRNVAIGVIMGFILTWVAGFFGGTFQSYMYNFLPQGLVDYSPLYYINRTLVEFSTKGYSAYTGTCIAYLMAIIVVFGIFGAFLMSRKLEEQ